MRSTFFQSFLRLLDVARHDDDGDVREDQNGLIVLTLYRGGLESPRAAPEINRRADLELPGLAVR